MCLSLLGAVCVFISACGSECVCVCCMNVCCILCALCVVEREREREKCEQKAKTRNPDKKNDLDEVNLVVKADQV